jgi:hypothetical protein
LVKSRSLLYKDLVVDAVLGTIKGIPFEIHNGEVEWFGGRSPWDESHAEPGGDAQDGEKKTVYVLLTKRVSVTSMILRLFLWDSYTHSSIALEQEGPMYSFNPVQGFTVERPIGKKRPDVSCKLYQIEVSPQAFSELEARIRWFEAHPGEYKFNYLGLVLTILRIPVGIGNRYYCSQFISTLLSNTEATELRKRPNHYLPAYFKREKDIKLTFKGEIGDLNARDTE